MEVRQLQIFCTLAEELNFTRTAQRVHTVQSNVTTQIKTLEAELGVRLFDRLGRRVVLTEVGRRFQPFAVQALNAMEKGRRAVAPDSEPSGPLRIGAPESVLTCPSLYPRSSLPFESDFHASNLSLLRT